MQNITNALTSIWNNKIRSILTVLGVVIGVTSVSILVSIGQGVKNDVSKAIEGFGTNVIAIVAGKIDTSNLSGTTGVNPADFVAGDILTTQDVTSIQAVPGVEAASPLSLVPGTLQYGSQTTSPTLTGAYPSVVTAFQVFNLDKGQMFTSNDAGNVIVLGPNAVSDLFGAANPIGQKVTIGKEQFTVIGTLTKAKSSNILGSTFDSISIIPFDTATRLNKNKVTIYRIIARASDSANITNVKNAINKAILANHGGTQDFTVLTQDDILGLLNTFVNLATAMVSAIAAISLIVGGIGIMNIMLVTVTERTREIGLRKAVGATRTAILLQFLTEAIVITCVGALIGLAITVATDTVVAAKSTLRPDLTLNVVLLAVGIAVFIGIIFGLWPALRAANKDPIEALRYE